MMQISSFKHNILENLTAFYNSQTLTVPYTPRIDSEMFERRVLQHPLFDPDGLLLAVDGNRIQGMVHTGFWTKPKAVTPQTSWLGPFWEFGTIVMFLFPREYPEAGNCLIRAAEDYSRKKGRTQFAGFSRLGGYLFYKDLYLAGEPLCWDGAPHIQNSLIKAGYRKTEPTCLMGMRLKERPKEIPTKIELNICVKDAPAGQAPAPFSGFGGKPGRMVLSYHQGEFTGSCGFARLENTITAGREKPIGAFGMGTAERFQRQGVGTHLLTRALGLMWDEGIRKVVLQTGDDNIPAVRFYEKLGFKTEPEAHAHGFRKEGTPEE
ncbi:MAG: GNAT family N-acetyltransferase [Planctomycetes bacterium]|nr:GNAT family N-acetyltransferase [Planctomycetota bacterium]